MTTILMSSKSAFCVQNRLYTDPRHLLLTSVKVSQCGFPPLPIANGFGRDCTSSSDGGLSAAQISLCTSPPFYFASVHPCACSLCGFPCLPLSPCVLYSACSSFSLAFQSQFVYLLPLNFLPDQYFYSTSLPSHLLLLICPCIRTPPFAVCVRRRIYLRPRRTSVALRLPIRVSHFLTPLLNRFPFDILDADYFPVFLGTLLQFRLVCFFLLRLPPFFVPHRFKRVLLSVR